MSSLTIVTEQHETSHCRRAQVIARQVASRRAPSRIVRSFVEAGVVTVCLLLLIATWGLDRYQLDSNSMAETLYGPHAVAACSECGLPFLYGVEGRESLERPVNCVNCGAANAVAAPQVIAGDRVLIDRSLLGRRLPRRWELVAFRQPRHASQVCVKRVVGLPGERIEIIDGDIYADGEIRRKSLDEQRAMAVLVHDDRFRPAATGSCWRASADSGWGTLAAGFEYRLPESSSVGRGDQPAVLNWLTYHHQRRNGLSTAHSEQPVNDVYGFNQTHPVPELRTVRDLILSFQLSVTTPGDVHIRASDGNHDFECSLATTGRVTVSMDGEVATETTCAPTPINNAQTVEVSLVDCCFLVALGGRVVVQYPFDRSPGGAAGTATPFGIAATGQGLRVEDLRIARDVYYGPMSAGADGDQGPPGVLLGADEYFVLSDNCPLGRDCRSAEFGRSVAANLFVGKPLAAYGNGQTRRIHDWSIQVPSPWRIRYIR